VTKGRGSGGAAAGAERKRERERDRGGSENGKVLVRCVTRVLWFRTDRYIWIHITRKRHTQRTGTAHAAAAAAAAAPASDTCREGHFRGLVEPLRAQGRSQHLKWQFAGGWLLQHPVKRIATCNIVWIRLFLQEEEEEGGRGGG
jgi:hypothetical protein